MRSSPPRLEVSRIKPPRERDRIVNLSGVIEATIRVCSKEKGDEFDSYLHIGSGKEAIAIAKNLNAIAKEIKRVGLARVAETQWQQIVGKIEHMPLTTLKGTPVIPASTIKGNIRSRIELSTIPTENGKVLSCFSTKLGKLRSWRHAKIWNNAIRVNRGEQCNYAERPDAGICQICDIFGAPGLASLVSFSDFMGYDVKLENIEGKRHMRIMAVAPGSLFRGKIFFRNLKQEEIGLFLIGMGIQDKITSRPLLMGRLKYRGELGGKTIGRIKYILNSIRISSYSQPVDGIKPDHTYTENELQELIKKLVMSAERSFEGQIHIVDEVKELERV